MTFDLQILHSALGGEICNGQILCPGPGHSPEDRSLAVKPSFGSANGFIVKSFSPRDDWRSCVDYVNDRLRRPRWQPGERREHRSNSALSAKTSKPRENSERAKAIWNAGRDPRGTAAEKYLAARKLDLPPDLCGDVLRYHPECPWKDGDTERTKFIPCLVVAFTAVTDNTITGIHRIRVDRPGLWPKTDRKMLGVTAGSAIRIDADYDVEYGLAICEGLETGLAGRDLGFRPVWALGSASAIGGFPVLPGINAVTILAETDDTGANAAAVKACGNRWAAAGCEVIIATPRFGGDMNGAVLA